MHEYRKQTVLRQVSSLQVLLRMKPEPLNSGSGSFFELLHRGVLLGCGSAALLERNNLYAQDICLHARVSVPRSFQWFHCLTITVHYINSVSDAIKRIVSCTGFHHMLEICLHTSVTMCIYMHVVRPFSFLLRGSRYLLAET